MLPESLSSCYQKLSKLPVFRCYYSACYQTFTAVLDSPESALVTRSSLMLATKLYQFFTTSLSLLPDLRCCPRQPRICPCYQILSRFATNCPLYQFFAATNLPLLPDFRCCPRQPRICPCYQILSLQLLRSLGPRPSPFHLVLCLSRTFSLVSLTDMLLRSLGPGPSPFRLPSHDGITANSATLYTQ